jgi:energy-coupling factor transporter ATP-binding protein EcfA2
MAIIEVQDLTYTYPTTKDPALRDITFQVDRGEFLAIVGPNESGKSSLCYALSGFIPHFYRGSMEGKVQVAEIDIQESKLADIVLKVGLVFQNPFNQMSGSKFTVFEEIAFGLENVGVPREEMIPRVEKVMAQTGISDLAERAPYSLSGGQQQRVAIASILVMEPEVLVLDEPTSQLDPIGSREVFQVIKEMSKRGMTVVMVEHKIEWVAEFADRLIALHEGKISLEGDPHQVLTSAAMEEIGVGASRYAMVAQRASKDEIWPDKIPLPITLDEAVAGFTKGLHAH